MAESCYWKKMENILGKNRNTHVSRQELNLNHPLDPDEVHLIISFTNQSAHQSEETILVQMAQVGYGQP